MHIVLFQRLQKLHSDQFYLWCMRIRSQELHINVVPVNKVWVESLPPTIKFSNINCRYKIDIMLYDFRQLILE